MSNLFRVIRPYAKISTWWCENDYWRDYIHNDLRYVIVAFGEECFCLHSDGRLSHYGNFVEQDVQHHIDNGDWYISEPTNQFHFKDVTPDDV